MRFPILIGKDKYKSVRLIKERMQSKIQGWQWKMVSQVGKETLIQVVAQAIPIYMMNCFMLRKGFIHDVNMLLTGFW